jgi:DNA polymerase-3 subunit alpha
MQYIELHRHSDDSYLDGCSTATMFAERAAELGMWALAQTDHGNINGALKHMKACERFGIQPIMGIEAYYRPRVVREKEWQHRKWHLILLAQNLTGWHNLLRISSAAFGTQNFYQYPTVTDELLDLYHEGLICTTACVLGPLSYLIENSTNSYTEAWIELMAQRFKDRLYFEIQPHDFDRQRAVNKEIVSYASKWGIPLSVGGDAHYAYKGWVDTQKILILIGTNTTEAEFEERAKKREAEGLDPYELWHDGIHLLSTDEVLSRFASFHPGLPADVVYEAINNNENIARSIPPFLLDRSLKMPQGAPSQEEAERRVREWCREGMERIGKASDPVYEHQLEHELQIMREKKVFDYIYMTGDVVRWARSSDPLPSEEQLKRPMRVGSSRGSAGASLVCFTARITGINPITHKLKFERFLNPGRKGLPDIDVDFPDDRRDEVKEYVARKYGRDHVADIVAMQRFTPRAAIQDVARILGIDYQITKAVTDQFDPVNDEDLEAMREYRIGLDRWAHSYPEAWGHAVRLENHGDPLSRRLSKHAGGVIITPNQITEYMPTIRASEEDLTPRTAWSETPRLSIVDDFGFCKWDFLSITGMTQQDRIVTMIAQRTGVEIDLDQLPVCMDPYDVEGDVMEVFKRGLTLGVWQFESAPITAFLKRARPQNIVDLSAVNALFRPGPMGSGGHNRYVKRKNGEESYELPEILQPVLSDTYSALCFQEQIMETFQVLCGYSAAQADDIRKEIDKLNRGKSDQGRIRLAARYEEFILKASEKIGEESAKAMWTEILPYTGYSFNRPHSAGYSVQAYQDAWLKVHYPFEFYAVLLTLEYEKAPRAIREARHFGVSIQNPDINRSDVGFTIDFDAKAIRYGLIGVDGIGLTAARQAIEVRQRAGGYASLEHFEFANSFKYSKLNRGHRQALVEAGALDSLGARVDWTEAQKAQTELKRLKMALRPGGTFGEDEELILGYIHTQEEFDVMSPDDGVVIAGKISDVRKTVVKRGRQAGQDMALMRVQLGLDVFHCTLFPAVYATSDGLIEVGRGVIVRGHKDARESIIAAGVMAIEEFVAEMREKETV